MARPLAIAWAEFLFCRLSYHAKQFFVVAGPIIAVVGIMRGEWVEAAMTAGAFVLSVVSLRSGDACPLPPNSRRAVSDRAAEKTDRPSP